jgi:predicted small metal-binding protein
VVQKADECPNFLDLTYDNVALSYAKCSGCCPFKLTVARFNLILNKERNMIMKRYFIDCRDYPSDVKCTLALSADTKEELLEAVVQHGTKVHGYEDTPEFRKQIVKGFTEMAPPA